MPQRTHARTAGDSVGVHGPRAFIDLVRECTGAVMFGSAIGALSFAVLGFQRFQRPGAVGGALVGAVIGAFSGLDHALPPPRRRAGDTRGPGMGPFRSGASYLFAALAAVVLSFYLSGTLTLECTRVPDGVRCSRITTGWFNNAQTSRTDYGPILAAYEGGPGQIVITTSAEERYVIDGFDATALEELKRFLASPAPSLVVSSQSLAMFPLILWGIAAAVALLGIWCLFDGVRRLRSALGELRVV